MVQQGQVSAARVGGLSRVRDRACLGKRRTPLVLLSLLSEVPCYGALLETQWCVSLAYFAMLSRFEIHVIVWHRGSGHRHKPLSRLSCGCALWPALCVWLCSAVFGCARSAHVHVHV